MKKIRYIPYGYTVRDGRTIIEHDEADVIRYIFEEYIKGASLKDLAEELTRLKVPYTEKTDIWDKARISRIIENAKYIGSEEYDPIIDEDIYEEAVMVKHARLRSNVVNDNPAIELLKNRVKCAKCGSPMVRRVCSKLKVKESWTCSNAECGISVKLSDTILLQRITSILNRIILNTDLMMPSERKKAPDSSIVAQMQSEIDAELQHDYPSEEFITAKIADIASQLYRESQAQNDIAAHIVKKKASQMKPTESFDCRYFSDLADTVLLSESGTVTLITKTSNQITEGDDISGSCQNP